MLYLHIPKTGGQALATRLASAFRPDECYVMQQELRYPADVGLLTQLLATKKFIEAHVSGELLQDRQDMDVLVTVRDPIEQAISNYRHIRREPRSLWHRPARELSPAEFFDHFGDFFTDHQTRYLLSAFVPAGSEIILHGRLRALHAHLYEAVDRVRWLVPTEAIDEFVTLWSLEAGRSLPTPSRRVNQAPPDNVDAASVRQVLLDRPHLYAFDTVLHQIARERFAAYRKQVMDHAVPWLYPDDSRCAYASGATGIWLTENWYDPESHDGKWTWWAGPTNLSRVRIRRETEQRFLQFDINVVNGIRPEDISVWQGATERLNVVHVRRSDELTTVYVPLDGLATENELLIRVPDCFAGIMISPTDKDITRRSFVSSNWKLLDALPQA